MAVQSVCHSLGGCNIPSVTELAAIRWPYILSEAFSKASIAARTTNICTAIHIEVSDVEVMRNPAKANRMCGELRPGTFAHSCDMTVSPAGVYFFKRTAHVDTLCYSAWRNTTRTILYL